MSKSLYEVKLEKKKAKNENIISDMDYVLRDKKEEKKKGNPNTICLNSSSKPTAKKTPALKDS